MKKASTLFAVFVFLTQVVGCADTPDVIVHDWLVFWNEVADYQLQAFDEATAAEIYDGPRYKQIKKRYDDIKDREDKKVLERLDKDKEVQLNYRNACIDYYDETVATAKRLNSVHKRMNAIIMAVLKDDVAERERKEPGKSHPYNWKLVAKLVKIRNLPDGYLHETPGGGAPGGGGGISGGGGGGGAEGDPEKEFNTLRANNPIFTGDVIMAVDEKGNKTSKVGVKWGDGLLKEMFEYKKKREDDQKAKDKANQKAGDLFLLPEPLRLQFGWELAAADHNRPRPMHYLHAG